MQQDDASDADAEYPPQRKRSKGKVRNRHILEAHSSTMISPLTPLPPPPTLLSVKQTDGDPTSGTTRRRLTRVSDKEKATPAAGAADPSRSEQLQREVNVRKKTIEILLKANAKFNEYGFYKRNFYDHATAWDTSIILVMPETALEKDASGQYLPVRHVDSSGKAVAAEQQPDGAAGFDALASRASTARGKRMRLAIFRPDSGRIFLTGPRTLYAETFRSDHARIQKLEICADQWGKRHRESESTCKHSKYCRRPEACMLGIRVMKFPVITGTLLPLWARLQRCLQVRWDQSETMKLWKNSAAGGKEGAKAPKPPLRVVHLVHEGKPVLGLCLPHGIAEITIRTLKGETKKEDDEARAAAAAAYGGGASAPLTKRAQQAAHRAALVAAYSGRPGSSRAQSTDPFPPQDADDDMRGDNDANPSAPPIITAAPLRVCKGCSHQTVLNPSGFCARCAQKPAAAPAAAPYAPAPFSYFGAAPAAPQRVSPLASTVPAPRPVPVYAPAPRTFMAAPVAAPQRSFAFASPTAAKPAAALSNPAGPTVRVGHACAQCGKSNARPCTGCNAIYYCTRECQVAHWVRQRGLRRAREESTPPAAPANRNPPLSRSYDFPQPKHKPLCPAGKK